MKTYKPTVTYFLDKRAIKQNQKFPLKLSVCFKRIKKRYATGVDLTEIEWHALKQPKLTNKYLKEVKIKIAALASRANDVINKMANFSFDAYETAFYGINKMEHDISLENWFKAYMDILENEGREGTRTSYQTTMNSLKSFQNNIKITEVNKDFLDRYEHFMRRLDKSPTTIGIYLRQLRAVINRAIDAGIIQQENYPFKRFQIPSSRNIKKALNDSELQSILNYKAKTDSHQQALDFWTFSYLCNGMNFIDIVHLTNKNITGNFMHFTRQKTIRTKKHNSTPIKVALHPDAKKIINRRKGVGTDYLFPILNNGLSAKTVKHRTHKFIRVVNKYMDEIRLELGISQRVGTYVARHSFSTKLMRKGVPTAFIKESLGHSSITVTENYLGDFSDNIKQDYSNLLVDFT